MELKPGWQGRYYEDFAVGDHYQHPLGRTITETDNIWFALLTLNTHQSHINAEVGRSSEFGRCLVASTLTLAVAVGQSVADTSQNAIANLGWDRVQLRHPVHAGDTIWSESLVLAVRASASRPQAGVVRIRTRTLNQNGVEVLSFERTFYVLRRDAATGGDSAFPNPQTPLLDDAKEKTA